MITKILKMLQKNIDMCVNCHWYYQQNDSCQIKKCSYKYPYVTHRDRKKCKCVLRGGV